MSSHGDASLPAQWSPPYLLYLGNAADDLAIKTARGVAYWRPQWCVGQYRHPDCQPTLGLPDIGMAEAKAMGADTMMIGTANAGGVMPPEMVADAIAALDSGLNVVAGLHQKLRENADIVGLYNIAGGNRGIAAALDEIGRRPRPVFVAHELTDTTRDALRAGTLDVVLDQNPDGEIRPAIAAARQVALSPDAEIHSDPIEIGIFLRDNLR